MADPKTGPLPPASYFNFMQITHSEREFFLTAGQLSPQSHGTAHLVSQLVTSPGHAKAILRALEENIRRYEDQFGTIPENPLVDPARIQ